MIAPSLRLLVRDELVGFAKSKVMLVLWFVLPALAIAGYFLLPRELSGGGPQGVPLTVMMALIVSSLAGTVAAVMIAVEIVNEKSRKVYELFVIRPIRPESIVWAKFIAVFACVTVACCVAVGAGLGVDAARGMALSVDDYERTWRALASSAGVIAVSTAVGVFFGVVSRSILVAVILILYVGQNFAILPLLPTYLGVDPGYHWVFHVATVLATALVMWGAGVLFRRAQY